ncbi:Serine/threonine-protein kinase DCLK2 [Liparis tanakae]|uniref:Serine/threonine-protein kinase DCLK2 n=1 Tax=Liparis tanakae TaxID=230148 RepID=A0A4Z2E261_9TELE|nr:Serine/threonine-protein kinase DCLK2 [Liparis tanakae]
MKQASLKTFLLTVNGNRSVSSSVITDKYKVGKVIGDGNFAVVKECVERSTGKEYALKIIDKARCCGKVTGSYQQQQQQQQQGYEHD